MFRPFVNAAGFLSLNLVLAWDPAVSCCAEAAVWQDLSVQLAGHGDSLPSGVEAQLLSSVTFIAPWSIEPVQKGRALVSQKSGEIFLVNLDTGEAQLLTRVTEATVHGQGGLLDLALAPDRSSPAVVYASASVKEKGQFTTALFRAQWNPSALLLDAHSKKSASVKGGPVPAAQQMRFERIFTARATESGGQHFGSRIVVTDPDTIYLSIGDRGQRDKAQDLSSHHGKTLRLDRQGRAHRNNPFQHTPGALPEIWSLGHRNPQGLWWDPQCAEYGAEGALVGAQSLPSREIPGGHRVTNEPESSSQTLMRFFLGVYVSE